MLLKGFHLPDGPDWRWQTATMLYQADKKPSRRADRWIKAAFAYLRQQGKQQDDIREAHRLAMGPVHITDRAQAVLMCADIDPQQAAVYLGIAQPVLEAHEALFWNVFPFHDQPGAMISRTVTPAECNEPWDLTRPAFQKRLAACNGFRLLRPVLEPAYMTPEIQKEFDSMKEAQEIKDWAMMQFFRPINAETITQFTDEVLDIMREDVNAGHETPKDGISNIAAILQVLQALVANGCCPLEMKARVIELLRKIELTLAG